ncbi:hypothetical protein AALO_G00214580 [Alosa alosa]|uniref:Uncharacterized protein n=1 Tax=Alosa alosa TaxID=278164 RepID=A0AAV6G0I6_9TELE|nr:hypothetical protein AALO_G00214580 [Alosa alosa]
MVQMDMRGVADDMRVSLLCLLLLFGRWNLLLYGALANPYQHEYGKYEDGSTVYGSGPELYNPERTSTVTQSMFPLQVLREVLLPHLPMQDIMSVMLQS